MAKVKLTKTELKKQRDSLEQFERFLPTLQLKKQQLQMEMRKCQKELDKVEKNEKELFEKIDSWSELFGPESIPEKIHSLLKVDEIQTDTSNIAGINVPILNDVSFKIEKYDVYLEQWWIDDAVDTIKEMVLQKAKAIVIREQYRLISKELRTTTQRVNLFEKIMIPGAKQNIRRIRIYLGDMDTAAVGRSKIAKRKSQETAA